MNKAIRSFFSVLTLVSSVFVVGCGTTGNPVVDRAATYGALGAVAGNLATGNSEGAGKGAALGILFGALGGGFQQQQQQFPQQQVAYHGQQGGGQNSLPCAPGFRQVGWQGAARVCVPAQQPQQYQHPQYQQPQHRQCGMWAGDCNQQMRAPVIPAAPCRMVNVPAQWDQYGRPVAYQQRQQC
jgi:hypothetical protein